MEIEINETHKYTYIVMNTRIEKSRDLKVYF